MSLISRGSLALLLLGACTVPSFGIAPDTLGPDAGNLDSGQPDSGGTVDACTTQMETGKLCGGDCPACANGQS